MSDVVGCRAYHAGRAKHIAGVTARGDTLTIRLTAPSPTLPARLASDVLLRRAADHADLRRRASGRSRWPARTTSRPTCPSAGSCCDATRTTAGHGRRRVPRDRHRSRRRRRSARWRPSRPGAPTTSPPCRRTRRRARPALRAAERRGAGRRPAVLQRRRSRRCTTSRSTRAGRCSRPDACAKR